MEIRFKKLSQNARAPRRGSEYAAGADLCALCGSEIEVAPGETVFVHTGLAAAIPAGYAGFVFARSGLASKTGLAPANKVGVIDSDYRGEIIVSLHNHSGKNAVITPGERVAQLVIMPVVMADFVEAEELDDTERGSGGFGSTGK